IDTLDVRPLDENRIYISWTMVVFYKLDTDPLRNLTLFDGLDIVEEGAGKNQVSVNLSGFLVPSNAAFDAKLAVLAYEGDDSINATITAQTNTDFFILGAFVTSISTIKPDFTSTTKTFVNESRGAGEGVRAGDTLRYTITTTNKGNDPAVGAALTDILQPGVT